MSSVERSFWIWFRALEDDSQCLRRVAAAKCGMRSRQVSDLTQRDSDIRRDSSQARSGRARVPVPTSSSHTYLIPNCLLASGLSRSGVHRAFQTTFHISIPDARQLLYPCLHLLDG